MDIGSTHVKQSTGYKISASFYSEDVIRSAKNVTGYRIKVSKRAPDYMWYQKNFNDYATGETPNRTKDTDASKTVKMPS